MSRRNARCRRDLETLLGANVRRDQSEADSDVVQSELVKHDGRKPQPVQYEGATPK